MRYFNTSGPNIAAEHYTIERSELIDRGRHLVARSSYFTIWAPRQTGKSTYFRQLAGRLESEGYEVARVNFENYREMPESSFMKRLYVKLQEFWGEDFTGLNIGDLFLKIEGFTDRRLVLIIDEVEGINPEYFGTFLHSIRNAYHSRETHALKSVILVGVSNILGVAQDNASPFNIADNLDVPYFTDAEVQQLLGQHEAETGQRFDPEVTARICHITANQPGLVNGFAHQLVTRHPGKATLGVEDYLQVEDWYVNKAVDKNISNIINKAKEHRHFVERLLFIDDKVPFRINDEATKYLHAQGLITWDEAGDITFWVPLYRKALQDAFYPYTNGERRTIQRGITVAGLFDEAGRLRLDRLITGYKEYVKRRGFGHFREKDPDGQFLSIPESALVYSFETYIQAFLQAVGGKSYREAHTGLGRSDLTINVNGQEYLVETKIYYYERQFLTGKAQLAYYCRSLGLDTGVYVVFRPDHLRYPPSIVESVEEIEGVAIYTFLVGYDEEKWEE